jgi:hypothetical protein
LEAYQLELKGFGIVQIVAQKNLSFNIYESVELLIPVVMQFVRIPFLFYPLQRHMNFPKIWLLRRF